MTGLPPSTPTPTSPTPAPSNGIGTAGMVLGIISAATCWIWCAPFVPIVTGIVGLILSILGLSKAKKIGVGRGGSMAGMICSICGIVIGIAVWVILILWINTAHDAMNTWQRTHGNTGGL